MTTRLDLARLVVRYRGRVALGWLMLATALLPLARGLERRLDVSGRVEGSDSAAVEAALAERFESPFARSAILVVTGVPAPETAAGRDVLEEIVTAVRGVRLVTGAFSYLDTADPLFLGAGGTFVVVGLEPGDVDAAIPSLRATTTTLATRLRVRCPQVALSWTGEPMLNYDIRRASATEVHAAEARALPLTFALLLFAFGGLVAGLLPALTGALAITLALGAAALLSGVMPLAVSLQGVVSMLGLGLGIDYALLTVSRFRESLESGRSPEGAAEDAVRHAGHTVMVSGSAVAIGFLGLLVVPLREIRSVAIGGLLVVTASMLLATTLLPGVLAWLGPRVEAGRLPGRRPSSHGGVLGQWGVWVCAHPLLALVLAGTPVTLLALEARRLQVGLPREWLPPEVESTRGLRELEAMGRSGLIQTVRIVLELPEEASALSASGWAATRRLSEHLAADPRVAEVRSLRTFAGERADDLAFLSLLPGFLKRCYLSGEGEMVLLEVIPREGATSTDLGRFVRELRRADAEGATGLRGTRLRVGGVPAMNADYEDAVGHGFPAAAVLVVGLTFLALFLAFRSVLISLKAVALNLLSVAAAFGALVVVFQDGRGAYWLGLAAPPGSILPAVPVVVFCIVFGLSMDYEVFLVARVAEARRAGLGDAEGLVFALSRTAGVITSAAAIMVAVFGAFAHGGFLLVKMLGFALAVAVLIDATLIRIALGPALLRLFGRFNWWPAQAASPTRDARLAPAGG